jgi:thioredoxin 1
MDNVREITAVGFDAEVLQSPQPLLVDFYAPWCGPCKALAPLLDQVAGELAGQIKFVKLNVDDAHALAQQYGITGVPTLMLFRNGQAVDTLFGGASPRALKQWLANASAVPA